MGKGVELQEHLPVWKTENGSGQKQSEGKGRLGQVAKSLEGQDEGYGLCPTENGGRGPWMMGPGFISVVTLHC